MDAPSLVGTLTWQLAAVCGLAFALGAIGGAMHERTMTPPVADADASPPPVPRWRRALVGGVAAVGVLYVTDPETGIALAGGSLAAGYAGQAVLAALEARALAALAQAEMKERSKDIRDTLEATDMLTNQAREVRTPEQEASIRLADAIINRMKQKYARRG